MEKKSQASESKGRQEEKIEGVKNSAQTLTLREEVSTEKMGEKGKRYAGISTAERILVLEGKGFKLYLKRCTAPSFLLSSSLLLTALNVKEWEGEGLDIWLRT